MNISRQKRLIVLIPLIITVCGCSPPEPAKGSNPHVASLPVPAAEGSMGPNLIMGRDGTPVLSWIEPDDEGHALKYSTLADDSWRAPRTVVSGDNWFVNWADFPSVVPVSESLWGAHWLVSQEAAGYAYDVHTAISQDAGLTWSEAMIPHSDNTDTEHGFVTIFADQEDIGLVWLDGRKMVNDYDEADKRASGMTLRSANFGIDRALTNEALVDDLTCDCCQTDVALTRDGPVAVYRNRTVDEVRDIYVSRREFGEWQPGYAVYDDHWGIDACPVNGPVIQATDSTVVVAWFTAPGESPQVKVAWSIDSGRSFADPVEVTNDRPLGHVGAALLPKGKVAISWLRSNGKGGAEMMLTLASPSGEVAIPYVLREAANVFAFSVPQLSLYGDNLLAVWTSNKEGTYGVASALVPIELLTSR